MRGGRAFHRRFGIALMIPTPFGWSTVNVKPTEGGLPHVRPAIHEELYVTRFRLAVLEDNRKQTTVR